MINKIFFFIFLRLLFLQKNKLYGKIFFQKYFFELHFFSLKGMNFYNSNRNTNGELNVIYQVKNTFKNNKDPLILFDVGANIGEYSKQLIEIFRETRMTIYAFEPAKKTYQKLHDNLKNYNNICLLNIGLSHKEQQGILYSEPTGQSPLASLYQRELKHINLEMNVSEEIKLNTIDNFCED